MISLIKKLVCLIANLLRALQGKGPSIGCWMNANPDGAACVKWQFVFQANAYDVPDAAKLPYNNWSSQQKTDLQKAFDKAWAWYSQGSPFANLQETITYPPVNLHESVGNDNSDPYTSVSEAWVWDMYTRYVAHQQLVEIKGLVPWSLTAYGSTAL